MLLEAALSEGRGVFVVGVPGFIEKSVGSLPPGFAFEPVAEEKWMGPAYSDLSLDEIAPPGEEGRARSGGMSSKIVKITRVTPPEM